jgi:hypothetical protein
MWSSLDYIGCFLSSCSRHRIKITAVAVIKFTSSCPISINAVVFFYVYLIIFKRRTL